MVYPKTKEYIETIGNIASMLNQTAYSKNDHRMFAIASLIKNYYIQITVTQNATSAKKPETNIEYINMVPFFEYLSLNKIELYDLKNIKLEDVDVKKEGDLERYVLTHIYYITQK